MLIGQNKVLTLQFLGGSHFLKLCFGATRKSRRLGQSRSGSIWCGVMHWKRSTKASQVLSSQKIRWQQASGSDPTLLRRRSDVILWAIAAVLFTPLVYKRFVENCNWISRLFMILIHWCTLLSLLAFTTNGLIHWCTWLDLMFLLCFALQFSLRSMISWLINHLTFLRNRSCLECRCIVWLTFLFSLQMASAYSRVETVRFPHFVCFFGVQQAFAQFLSCSLVWRSSIATFIVIVMIRWWYMGDGKMLFAQSFRNTYEISSFLKD